MMNTTTSIQAQTSVSERAKAAIAALALGSVLIFTVGFAHSSSVHNAAHDTRHTLAFPCH
jgi:cobalt transporter subunit CbtB